MPLRLRAAPYAIGLLVSAILPVTAPAQTFQCTDATAGQLSCQAGIACECRFDQGGAMDGTAPGWRWDCGILRPRCGPPLPATIDTYRDALPDSLSFTDQSVDIGIDQNNTQLQWTAPALDF